jgi:hypothetical protein
MRDSYMGYLSNRNYSDEMDSGYGANSYQPDQAASMSSAAPAASGAGAMSGPAGAGIMVGGQFLTQYLAQKAEDERARRARESQNIQQYAQNQNQGLSTMNDVYARALK